MAFDRVNATDKFYVEGLWVNELYDRLDRQDQMVAGSGIEIASVGGSKIISMTALGDGSGSLPIGQYPDQMNGTVTINQGGIFYNRAHSMT
jgi:hypothetical protein